MSRGSEYTFFQRQNMNSQQVHEKVLKITNHQGNPNQNPVRYHLIPTFNQPKRQLYFYSFY